MNIINFIKSLKVLDYYLVNSACNTMPEYAPNGPDSEPLGDPDAALDSTISEFFEFDGYTEFTTSSIVDYSAGLPESVQEEDVEYAIHLTFSFVTRFRVDATEDECKKFFEEHDWLFRQRNATISHFLGGQILDKSAFDDIRLPMN